MTSPAPRIEGEIQHPVFQVFNSLQVEHRPAIVNGHSHVQSSRMVSCKAASSTPTIESLQQQRKNRGSSIRKTVDPNDQWPVRPFHREIQIELLPLMAVRYVRHVSDDARPLRQLHRPRLPPSRSLS